MCNTLTFIERCFPAAAQAKADAGDGDATAIAEAIAAAEAATNCTLPAPVPEPVAAPVPDPVAAAPVAEPISAAPVPEPVAAPAAVPVAAAPTKPSPAPAARTYSQCFGLSASDCCKSNKASGSQCGCSPLGNMCLFTVLEEAPVKLVQIGRSTNMVCSCPAN